MMLTAFLALLQALPTITKGFEAFTGAYFDAKVKIVTARIGGNVDVAKQIVSGLTTEGQTRVEYLKTVSQSKFLMFLVGGFALPWMFYQAKVVAWDNIMCMWFYGTWGYTPPIGGSVGEWSGLIIGAIFGTGGIMAFTHIWTSKNSQFMR